MGVRWRTITSNTELWEAPGEKSVVLKIRRRKWRWISHFLSKGYQSTERQALDWKPQGARRNDDRSKTGKGPLWTKKENSAKHGVKLR
jgi:hypothetical protein